MLKETTENTADEIIASIEDTTELPLETASEGLDDLPLTNPSPLEIVEADTDLMISELKLKTKVVPHPSAETFKRKAVKKIKLHYAIGTATIILSLLTMGIAILVSLNSPAGIIGALSVSPLILIYLGLEVLANVILNKRLAVKFNLKELIIVGSLILLTFLTSLVTLLNSNTEYSYERISERMENAVTDDIAKAFQDIPNISSVEVDLKLLSDNLASYKTLTGISSTDSLNVTISFTEPHSSISKFSKQAYEGVQILNDLPYNFNTITFLVDDRYNKIKATLDGNFMKFLTAEDIARYTYYFVDEGVDVDIPDVG